MVRTKPTLRKGAVKRKTETYTNSSEVDKNDDFNAHTSSLSIDREYFYPVTFLVVAVHLVVYFWTLHPSVPGGDSGELISVAHVLGVPHPPGYPLFSVVVHWFSKIVSVGSIAWRANAFSALCASGAGLLLHVATTRVTGSLASGVVATALFSFARLQWLYSITGEVFALNNFLVAMLIYQLVCYEEHPTTWRACIGAFWCGLALTNQHTAVLYAVVIVPWVLYRGANAHELFSKPGRNLVPVAICFAVAVLPYAYIPWSALRNTASLTWGDQRSIEGFFKHVLRQEYGTFSLAKGGRETASFDLAIQTHLTSLARETFYLCPLLSVVGVVAAVFKGKRVFRCAAAKVAFAVLMACLVFYMVFFNWRANLDLSNPLLAGVQERFWMQPNLLFAMAAGVGYTALFHTVGAWVLQPTQREGVALVVAMALLGVQINVNFAERDESSNFYVRDFGRSLLEGLPNNSILLTYGDLPGNAARYVQTCDNVRPDVRLIDLEMMTMDWYLPMVSWSFPDVVFPGNPKVYRFGAIDMKKFFDANIDKFDIFVFENLNPDDKTWENDYEVWRHGIARAIKRKGTKLDPNAWLDSALPAIPTHPLPDPIKYDNRTWERVVFDGGLASGVYLALFFEEHAKKSTVKSEAIALFEAAGAVYEHMFQVDALQQYKEKYWHKNCGLVYHNLISMGAPNTARYIDARRRHWQAYIDSDPDDAQTQQIQQIIS